MFCTEAFLSPLLCHSQHTTVPQGSGKPTGRQQPTSGGQSLVPRPVLLSPIGEEWTSGLPVPQTRRSTPHTIIYFIFHFKICFI